MGRLHVKDTEKPEQYLEQLCSLAGFPSTEEILIFEVGCANHVTHTPMDGSQSQAFSPGAPERKWL